METNICLLSNNILCDFYDIYKYKLVLLNETKLLLDKNINNLKIKCIYNQNNPIILINGKNCSNNRYKI